MKRWMIAAVISLIAYTAARADDTFDADSLVFQNVFCSRVGDRTSYSVVGTGAFRAPRTDDLETFVVTWLNRHPHATATVVEHSRLGPQLGEMNYVWIDHGVDSLNVDLVRQGIVPGGMMADGVEYLTSIKDVARLDKNSPDFPKRVVSDVIYQTFMEKVKAAEIAARADKIGLWSDKYSGMMEQEGYL